MRARLPEWMSADFSVLRAGRATAIVRADFVSAFERHRLISCPAPAPALRALPGGTDDPAAAEPPIMGGRAAVRVVPAGALGEAVVRPYRRGGFVGRYNERRYFMGARAFHELVATCRLRRRGAPVPEALAAVQAGLRPGYAACLVTRRIGGARTAATVLAGASPAGTAPLMRALGRAVRRLHEAGGVHADLNAHNLLVAGESDDVVTVIDLDRVRVLPRPVPRRAAARNLARLRRSLGKLGLEAALAAWAEFEAGYGAPPEPPAAA